MQKKVPSEAYSFLTCQEIPSPCMAANVSLPCKQPLALVRTLYQQHMVLFRPFFLCKTHCDIIFP
jgi:hypothetical protein